MNHQFNIEIANLSCNWAIANQTCYNKYIQLVCGCFCGEILGKILQIMSSLQAWIANLKFWSHSDVKCAFQIMLHVTSHCGNFYYAWPITSLEWRAKRGQSITVGYCLLTDSGGDKFDLNPRSYLLLVYEETIPNTYKKRGLFNRWLHIEAEIQCFSILCIHVVKMVLLLVGPAFIHVPTA